VSSRLNRLVGPLGKLPLINIPHVLVEALNTYHIAASSSLRVPLPPQLSTKTVKDEVVGFFYSCEA
jgi:hypothetical protein